LKLTTAMPPPEPFFALLCRSAERKNQAAQE